MLSDYALLFRKKSAAKQALFAQEEAGERIAVSYRYYFLCFYSADY